MLCSSHWPHLCANNLVTDPFSHSFAYTFPNRIPHAHSNPVPNSCAFPSAHCGAYSGTNTPSM